MGGFMQDCCTRISCYGNILVTLYRWAIAWMQGIEIGSSRSSAIFALYTAVKVANLQQLTQSMCGSHSQCKL